MVKPFLSDKMVNSPKIMLVEKNEIINNEEKKAEIFNTYFTNIVSNLKIPLYQDTDFAWGFDPFVGDDPITYILEKYKNHPSIIAIKNFCHESKTFNFETMKREDVLEKIKSLDRSKTFQNGDVPTKIIKENVELFTDFIHSALNEAIQSGNFPSCLKWAEVTPIFEKGLSSQVDNYRPVSILPNVSKLFERPLFQQITLFFDQIFSVYHCGFRKGINPQHCLIAILEKWNLSKDKGTLVPFAALLLDLSKAFDCLLHELLIAKLAAYGFSQSALKLMYTYQPFW